VWQRGPFDVMQEWQASVAPTIVDDRVVIGTPSGTLESLDVRSGLQVWNVSISGRRRMRSTNRR